MKRYIKNNVDGAIITASSVNFGRINKVPLKKVLHMYVDTNVWDAWSTHVSDSDVDSIKSALVSGLLMWKRNSGSVVIHHKDFDESNNIDTNMILMTNAAHSYLHNLQTYLALEQKYNVAHKPAYRQGVLALESEKRVLNMLLHEIDGNDCDMQQVTAILTDPDFIDRVILLDSSDISDAVASALQDVKVIQKSSIQKVVDSYIRSIESTTPDVDYVDESTAYYVTQYLKQLASDSSSTPLTLKSIETIQSFIRESTLSDEQIMRIAKGNEFDYRLLRKLPYYEDERSEYTN